MFVELIKKIIRKVINRVRFIGESVGFIYMYNIIYIMDKQ